MTPMTLIEGRRDDNMQSGKYGKVEVESRTSIEEDEPVFIFRARDQLAVLSLQHYLANCKVTGCPESHIEGIENEIARFLDWQKDNDPRKPGGAEKSTMTHTEAVADAEKPEDPMSLDPLSPQSPDNPDT